MQNRNDRQNVPTLNRPQFSEDKMPEAGQAGSSWLGSKLPEIPGEQYFKPWHFKQMSISLSPPSPPFLQCSHIFFLNSHYLNAVVTQHRFQSFFFFFRAQNWAATGAGLWRKRRDKQLSSRSLETLSRKKGQAKGKLKPDVSTSITNTHYKEVPCFPSGSEIQSWALGPVPGSLVQLLLELAQGFQREGTGQASPVTGRVLSQRQAS